MGEFLWVLSSLGMGFFGTWCVMRRVTIKGQEIKETVQFLEKPSDLIIKELLLKKPDLKVLPRMIDDVQFLQHELHRVAEWKLQSDEPSLVDCYIADLYRVETALKDKMKRVNDVIDELMEYQ